MIKKLLACIIPVLGMAFEHVLPTVSQQEDPSILYRLKSILILGDANLVRMDPTHEINGVKVKGANFLLDHPDFLADLQKKYVGKPLTQSTLRSIQQSITEFYESKNYPLVVVSVPKQSYQNGVLQLVVKETVLGEIRCKGNQYVLSDQLKKYIRSKAGQPISSKELMKDLAFMNHNPFRRTDAVFTPGKSPGVADLELLTVDRWPYRVYVGADNTGTIATERNRIFFGVNLGKTIVQDSEVSYQYTTAPNGHKYYSHTGMVRVPLPWIRHIIQAFGGYAHVEPDKVSTWKPRGKNWEACIRYRIPLFDGLGTLQEIVLGYDFKEMGSEVQRRGISRFERQADTSQFVIGYNFGTRDRRRKVSLNTELFISPGNMTNQNDGTSYKRLRRGANPHYAYFKIVHSFLQEIASGWRFSYNITGQIATTSLLPNEQMTMTGYNGVRGFEERILNLDNAMLLNFTVEAPHFSPAYWLGWCKHYDDLSFLAFFDTGFGGNYHNHFHRPNFQSLGSIGPSVRYELSRYATAHFDYGFQLWHSGFKSPSDSRYNFGLIFSY
jgi:hemolysin activation/secretion protein